MAVHNAVGARQRPQTNRTKSTVITAPMGGINTRDNLSRGDLDYCMYTYNLQPSEYGCKMRQGFREFANNIAGLNGVQTLITHATRLTTSEDKLFAVTSEGIYDISAGGDFTGILPGDQPAGIAFTDTSIQAGYGSFTQYTNDNNDTVLLYADSRNGLLEYTEATETWVYLTDTDIVGPVVANIRFVMAFKQRLWMIEENSADAWYLPVAAKKGTATRFSFGPKFLHGGEMVGLWNWTIDAGVGIDDYLVAVSRAGDVAVYQGYDPDNAETFENRGLYYIGKIPAGHRIASEYGGNLNLLSAFGIVSMQDLISGVDSATVKDNSLVFKVAPIVRGRMKRTIDQPGWEVSFEPSAGVLILNFPTAADLLPGLSGRAIQLVMNITTGAWGFWRDMPMFTNTAWDGDLYFAAPPALGGDGSGIVQVQDADLDGVLLDGSGGVPKAFSILSAFSQLEELGVHKIVQFIRPQFLAA